MLDWGTRRPTTDRFDSRERLCNRFLGPMLGPLERRSWVVVKGEDGSAGD